MASVKSEFDNYAKGYCAGTYNKIKKALGGNFEAYLNIKADIIKENFKLKTKPQTFNILDYGCGNGMLIKLLCNSGVNCNFDGCDISGEMLNEAKKNLTRYANTNFFHVNNALSEGKYDLVILCNVLHHVANHKEKEELLKKIFNLLKQNGKLILFEHNPINPLTNLVVNTTDIDREAKLIFPFTLKKNLENNGYKYVNLSFMHFFPPKMGRFFTVRMERIISKLMIGAGYYLIAEK